MDRRSYRWKRLTVDGSKNTLKKIGLSQPSPQCLNEAKNQYYNNNQHLEYKHFIKTAHFLQICTEDIFGLTHVNNRDDLSLIFELSLAGVLTFTFFYRRY